MHESESHKVCWWRFNKLSQSVSVKVSFRQLYLSFQSINQLNHEHIDSSAVSVFMNHVESIWLFKWLPVQFRIWSYWAEFIIICSISSYLLSFLYFVSHVFILTEQIAWHLNRKIVLRLLMKICWVQSISSVRNCWNSVKNSDLINQFSFVMSDMTNWSITILWLQLALVFFLLIFTLQISTFYWFLISCQFLHLADLLHSCQILHYCQHEWQKSSQWSWNKNWFHCA